MKKYYRITEDASVNNKNDLAHYLTEQGIQYTVRFLIDIEDTIDFNWMATSKSNSVYIYSVDLSEEELSYIKLKCEGISIQEINPEPLKDISQRIKDRFNK